MAANRLSQTSSLNKSLVNSYAPTTAAAAYTVPASSSADVFHGSVCNTSSGTAKLTLSILRSGDTFDGSHRVLSSYPVLPGDSLVLSDFLRGACLGAGDAIWWQADTANALAVVITGQENT